MRIITYIWVKDKCWVQMLKWRMIDILRNVERYCSLLLSSVFTVKHLELTFLSMLCRSYHYYSHLSLSSVFSMKISNVMLNLWSSLCAMVVLSFKGEYSKYQLTGHCSVVKKKKDPCDICQQQPVIIIWYNMSIIWLHRRSRLRRFKQALLSHSQQTSIWCSGTWDWKACFHLYHQTCRGLTV